MTSLATHRKLARNAAHRLDNPPPLNKGASVGAKIVAPGYGPMDLWLTCSQQSAGRWTVWVSDTANVDNVWFFHIDHDSDNPLLVLAAALDEYRTVLTEHHLMPGQGDSCPVCEVAS